MVKNILNIFSMKKNEQTDWNCFVVENLKYNTGIRVKKSTSALENCSFCLKPHNIK